MDIIAKNATFLFDKEGVIVLTDIEGQKPLHAEFVYDGKNCAILKREKEFFSLQNIAPMIREKIKSSEYVTIVEKSGDDIQSYDVKVVMVDDLEMEDNWNQYIDQITDQLKKNLSEKDFNNFLIDAENVVKSLEE